MQILYQSSHTAVLALTINPSLLENVGSRGLALALLLYGVLGLFICTPRHHPHAGMLPKSLPPCTRVDREVEKAVSCLQLDATRSLSLPLPSPSLLLFFQQLSNSAAAFSGLLPSHCSLNRGLHMCPGSKPGHSRATAHLLLISQG